MVNNDYGTKYSFNNAYGRASNSMRPTGTWNHQNLVDYISMEVEIRLDPSIIRKRIRYNGTIYY